MHCLEVITERNDGATLREFHAADEAGDWKLANRIAAYNPDLFIEVPAEQEG